MLEKAAIILAGGKSSRMGTNKALLEFGHNRLIDIAINRVEPLTKNIFISTNHVLPGLNYPQIPDMHTEIGPLGGIATIMQLVSAQWYLVLACDMPGISTQLLQNLCDYCHDSQAVIARTNDRLQPLAGWYNYSVKPIVEQQIRNRNFKMMDFLAQLNIKLVDVSDISWFKNVNTSSDLL